MKTALVVALCFVAGLVSWWSLERANAAGWVKTDWSAAISGGGTVPPGRPAEIIRDGLTRMLREPSSILLLLMAFQTPTLAAIVFRRHSIVQYSVLGAVAVLLVGDLGVAAAPDGGDFKGCTKCDFSYLMHFGFGFLSFLSSVLGLGVFLVLRVLKSKRLSVSDSTQQTVAADRREDAAPAER
jgi:hypothetical protein